MKLQGARWGQVFLPACQWGFLLGHLTILLYCCCSLSCLSPRAGVDEGKRIVGRILGEVLPVPQNLPDP